MEESSIISKKPMSTPWFASFCSFATLCSFLGSMTSVISGYDTGVMSGAAIFIQKDLKISDVKLEFLMGMINIYSLVGSAIAGKISDRCGRKSTIFIAFAIFFFGSVLMGIGLNYWVLMGGRFLAGVGIGFALVSAPVYTTELAPSSSRGQLSSLPEVFINFGVLLGYIANYFLSGLSLRLGWRLMLGIGAVPCVFMAIAVLFMPESPRWLVMKGRLSEAKEILLKTSSSKEEADERLQAIKEAAGIPLDCDEDCVVMSKKENEHQVWKELLVHPTPTVRRIFIAALGIQFFQQASGIDAVVLYSPRIFKKAGIVKENVLLLVTIAVGVMKTISILISTFSLDRAGRRPLLLSSVAAMIVSVLLLSFGLFTVYRNPGKEPVWAIVLSVAMVLCYVVSFSAGLGPIAWVYSSEIYPLRLRGVGGSLGAGMNRLLSGVVGISFLSMTKAMTTAGSFLFFGGVCIVAFIFFYVFLPETRGRNLEDMDGLFGQSRWRTAQNDPEAKTNNS